MKNRKTFFSKPNAKRNTLRDNILDTELDHLLGACQQHGVSAVLGEDSLPDDTFAEPDPAPALSLVYAAEEPFSSFADNEEFQNAITELRASRAA